MRSGTSDGFLTRAIACRPLAVFAAAWALGSAIALGGGIPHQVALPAGLALAVVFVLLFAFGKRSIPMLLVIAALFLGSGAVDLRLDARPEVADSYDVAISCTVAEEPRVEDGRLTARATDVTVNGEAFGYDIRVYIRGGETGLSRITEGDSLVFTGHFWQADGATNPGEFDFGEYLWRSGMAAYATGQLSDCEIVEGEDISVILRIRRALDSRIEEYFPKSQDLARALIIGDRSQMEGALSDAFSRAGIAHVLAVSGMHVSVMAMLVSVVFGWFLPRRAAYLLTVLLLLFYAAVTGFSWSVMRAVIMYAALGARVFSGAPSDGMTRLGLAALVILMIDPLAISDAGFQLSFAASGGILLLAKPIARMLGKEWLDARAGRISRVLSGAVDTASVTLAAQIVTLPIVANTFGTIPAFSVLANILLVPATLFAFSCSVIGVLLPFVAAVGDWLLYFVAEAAKLFSRLPLSEASLPEVPAGLGLLYAAAIVALSPLARNGKWRKAAAAACLLLVMALSALSGVLQGLGLKVVFLDAGQANAIVLYSGGSAYLVDVGDTDTPAADYIEYAGADVEGIFLTHPDSDHAAGLSEVLSVCTPDAIYLPFKWDEIEDVNEDVLSGIALAREMGIEIVCLAAGDEMMLPGGSLLTVLSPGDDERLNNSNEISLMFTVVRGEGSVMFTGDIPISAEPDLLPDIDVLQVAHHGSKSSTGQEGLAHMTPAIAVISVGENSYGHPTEEVLERLRDAGAEIYRTDEMGAVTVRLFRNGKIIVKVTI